MICILIQVKHLESRNRHHHGHHNGEGDHHGKHKSNEDDPGDDFHCGNPEFDIPKTTDSVKRSVKSKQPTPVYTKSFRNQGKFGVG